MDTIPIIAVLFLFYGLGYLSGAMERKAKKTSPREGHIRVGREWMTTEEYLKQFSKAPLPCEDAKRCPQAVDVTCEECRNPGDPMTMAEKEALVCPSCQDASAYNCAKCQEEENRAEVHL